MKFKFQAPWHHLFEHEGKQYHGGDVIEADESVAAADSRLTPTDEDVVQDVETMTTPESQPSSAAPAPESIPPAEAPVPEQAPDNTNVGEGEQREQVQQPVAAADARDEATMQQFNVTQQGQQQS